MELAFIGGLEILIILGIGLFVVLLPIIALIDIVKSNFSRDNDKLIWVLIVLFFNIIGSILYFAIGVNQKVRY